MVITDLEANGAAFEGGAVAFLSGALHTQSVQVREAAAIGLLDPPCCLLRREPPPRRTAARRTAPARQAAGSVTRTPVLCAEFSARFSLMAAASSNEGAPPPNLWGICALAGTHGAGGEWIACGSHAPCNCGGAELHLRTHAACVSCAGRVRPNQPSSSAVRGVSSGTT